MEGERIQCPFHGWEFSCEGKCEKIPYATSTIPEQARTESYPVMEINDQVLMWCVGVFTAETSFVDLGGNIAASPHIVGSMLRVRNHPGRRRCSHRSTRAGPGAVLLSTTLTLTSR